MVIRWFALIAIAMGIFLGTIDGSLGETSALLIIIGGIYLVARRMMSWQIPVALLARL